MAHFPPREGRPPRRPPQCLATFRSALSSLRFQPRPPQCQQLSGLLSPVSSLKFQSRSHRARPPWPRSSDRGASHFIYPAPRLSASARAKALYGALIPRGRDDLRVVRKPSPRQKIWKMGLPILDHNRPIRSQFTAGTPSPVSALGPCQLKISAVLREYPAQPNSSLSQ